MSLDVGDWIAIGAAFLGGTLALAAFGVESPLPAIVAFGLGLVGGAGAATLVLVIVR